MYKLEDINVDDDYIIKHMDMTISSDDIKIIIINKYKFLYINIYNKIYIYFADNIYDLLKDSNEFDEKTGMPIMSINRESKKYCIELIYDKDEPHMHLNFITTLPKGCNNKECQRLNGLFKILKNFLTKYHYKGVVSLNDDVQVNGEFITKKRALEGKKDISIYQKYGFKIDIILRNCIINAVKTNDIKTLNALTRNIPMVSLDISKFDQC